MRYLYRLSLVTNSGRRKKSIFLCDDYLNMHELSEDRMTNCLFLTDYALNHKNELRAYFRGLRGSLCLELVDIEKDRFVAGSDFIN